MNRRLYSLILLQVVLCINFASPNAMAERDMKPVVRPIYPDVALTDPAYEKLRILDKSGYFFDGMPDESIRVLTRYEFAVAIARAMKTITVQKSLWRPLQKDQRTWNALLYLIQDFTPDLNDLGKNSEQFASLQREALEILDSLKVVPSFRDVPSNHWAYAAIETLREQGILRGYPDGKFQTSN